MLRFLRTAVLTGVPFGLAMGLVNTFVWDKGGGLIKGAVAGVLFGLAIAGFAEWQRRRFTSENPCAPGEQLLKQGAANQFRGWEAVGGWLYLTDRRLLFRPHRYNVQKQGLEVPLTDIVETQVCATVWVIPNGLRVVTSQGAQRFVVEGRRSWVEAILQAREALPLA